MSKKEIISSYLINNVASLSKYKEFPSYQFINAETIYWHFNYWLNHKSNEKSKKEMLLKNLFFEGYCVWSNSGFQPSSIIKWRTDILISEEHLQPSIAACCLFKRGTYSDRFWVDRQLFRRPLPVFV